MGHFNFRRPNRAQILRERKLMVDFFRVIDESTRRFLPSMHNYIAGEKRDLHSLHREIARENIFFS